MNRHFIHFQMFFFFLTHENSFLPGLCIWRKYLLCEEVLKRGRHCTLYWRDVYKDLFLQILILEEYGLNLGQCSCYPALLGKCWDYIELEDLSSLISLIWPFISILSYHSTLSNFCCCHSVLNLFFSSSPTYNATSMNLRSWSPL